MWANFELLESRFTMGVTVYGSFTVGVAADGGFMVGVNTWRMVGVTAHGQGVLVLGMAWKKGTATGTAQGSHCTYNIPMNLRAYTHFCMS